MGCLIDCCTKCFFPTRGERNENTRPYPLNQSTVSSETLQPLMKSPPYESVRNQGRARQHNKSKKNSHKAYTQILKTPDRNEALQMPDARSNKRQNLYELLSPHLEVGDNSEIVSLLDDYFGYSKHGDTSSGFPNYGNTCYLNVGVQILKAVRLHEYCLGSFNFKDRAFLNLFLILRYWDTRTLSSENNSQQLNGAFRSFIELIFQREKEFQLMKPNDPCSFMLNVANQICISKWGCILNGLIDRLEEVEDATSREEFEGIARSNVAKMKGLPLLGTVMKYSATLDHETYVGIFRPYHDLSLSQYRQSQGGLCALLSSGTRELVLHFPQILTIKLDVSKDYGELEREFTVRDYWGKEFTYSLRAVSYGLSNHTFCRVFSQSTQSWHLFDDNRKAVESRGISFERAYTLHYVRKK